MRIAITGARGFLGRHLVTEFAARGHLVRGWHRPGSQPPERLPWDATGDHGRDAARAAEADSAERIEWVPGRLGDAAASESLVAGVDVVVHAGLFRGGPSFMSVEADPVEYFDVNVLGSLQLIEAAVRHRVGRFVFISSGAVHQRVAGDRPLDETHPQWPETLYGSYKASVESLVHAYGWSGKLAACSLRPTSIYGVDDPVEDSKWFGLVRAVAAGERVEASGGSKSVHAGDVAVAARLLSETDASVAGETFNCTDRMISEHEVAHVARRLSGSDAEITGTGKEARHEIVTEKLRRLGMRFGGPERLERTVAQLIANR